MTSRPTRQHRVSDAAKLLWMRDITQAQIGDAICKAPATVGFMLEGTIRIDPRVLDVLLRLTGDAEFVGEVQHAAREAWLERRPQADPADHLQKVTP